MNQHISVLLNETIDNLNIKKDGVYVDMTLGLGGHSSTILKEISGGHLFSFDKDIEAIKIAEDRLSKINNNYTIIKSDFVNIKEKLNEIGITSVDGIIFDLGVSSLQLDTDYRGFSYHNDALLDMRMDISKPLTAAVVVNTYTMDDLATIFFKYGEEKYSRSIAKNIVKYRETKSITTTLELVEIIKSSMPHKAMINKHPARKVFQALRIEVNDELTVFEKALMDSLELINSGGRICVITFHSLEDKICKYIFNEKTKLSKELQKLPVVPEHLLPKYKLITNKGVRPSDEEIDMNKRSRSATLRVIEKI